MLTTVPLCIYFRGSTHLIICMYCLFLNPFSILELLWEALQKQMHKQHHDGVECNKQPCSVISTAPVHVPKELDSNEIRQAVNLSFPLTVNDHTTRIHPRLSRIAPPILTFQQIALVKAHETFLLSIRQLQSIAPVGPFVHYHPITSNDTPGYPILQLLNSWITAGNFSSSCPSKAAYWMRLGSDIFRLTHRSCRLA